nr:hypothetical protein [Propionibacterium acidifaciens]
MSRGTTATGTGPVKIVEMPWRTPTRASEMSAVEAASSLGRVISASSPTQTRAATQAAATSTAKRAKSRCRSPSRRIAPATIGPEDGPRVVIAETMPIVVPSLSGVETVSVRFMPIGTTMPVPRACTMRCRGPARCGDEHDDEVRGERAENRAGQQSRPRAHRRSRCVRTERWRRPVTGTMIAAAGMQAVVTQPMAPEPTPGSCIIGVRTTLRRVSLKVARKVVAGGHDGGHRGGAAARA